LRKIFKLQDEKRKPERIVEAMKNEIRKYIKRERKKKLSDNLTMFWDFDCKFGKSRDNSEIIEIKELIKALDITLTESWDECYIEILAKEVNKPIIERATTTDEDINI